MCSEARNNNITAFDVLDATGQFAFKGIRRLYAAACARGAWLTAEAGGVAAATSVATSCGTSCSRTSCGSRCSSRSCAPLRSACAVAQARDRPAVRRWLGSNSLRCDLNSLMLSQTCIYDDTLTIESRATTMCAPARSTAVPPAAHACAAADARWCAAISARTRSARSKSAAPRSSPRCKAP